MRGTLRRATLAGLLCLALPASALPPGLEGMPGPKRRPVPEIFQPEAGPRGEPETDHVELEGEEAWQVRLARVEGAAAGVNESATRLRATATSIGAAGRMQSMGALVADARDLQRQVLSAGLAVEVMGEELATNE